ncbi:MAG: hypothetical protein GQ582_10175 [Methyloprofundus sp.]|nr:hypothetical protein [Methyloprofundus sp.]
MNLFTHNKVIKIFALILILLPSISMAGKHDERGHDKDRQSSERHFNDSGSKRKQHGRGHNSERHFSSRSKRKHRKQRRYERREQRRHYRKHHSNHGHNNHYDRHEYHYDRHHRNDHHVNHYAVNHHPHQAYQGLRFLFGLHGGDVDIHYGD